MGRDVSVPTERDRPEPSWLRAHPVQAIVFALAGVAMIAVPLIWLPDTFVGGFSKVVIVVLFVWLARTRIALRHATERAEPDIERGSQRTTH